MISEVKMTINQSKLPILLIIVLFLISCSVRSGSPVTPGSTASNLTSHSSGGSVAGTSRALWGIWNVSIDTSNWEVSIVPIRGPQYTVDVVKFLQPPAGSLSNLTITVTDVTDWFSLGKIGVDVGLRHPFPGLDQYTGFDVYGVFVAPGSFAGIYDDDVAYTNGDGEPALLNADGYTRWMNPVEFIENGTFFNFIKGKLGTQDIGLFTSTINAYRYFADGLEKDQSISDFLSESSNTDKRGLFAPGSMNVREYHLKFPMVGGLPKLTFQYAVVASWVYPDPTLSGDPGELDVPGDFPLSANAGEAVFVGITDNSSLFYSSGSGGGAIKLALEIFDWGALSENVTVTDEIKRIIIESPNDVIPGGYAIFEQSDLAPIGQPGSSVISSVFEVEIYNCTPNSNDDVPILITVENKQPDKFDPGTGVSANDDNLAAYVRFDVPVGGEIPSALQVIDPNGGETLWMALSHEITWDPGLGGVANVKLEWSTDNFVSDINTIIDSTENDGSYIWVPIPNVDTTTAKVRVSDVLGTDTDESDNNFTIALPVWLDFQDEVDVSTSTVDFATWTFRQYEKSYDEFSPALSQDFDGMVHMVWHGEAVVGDMRYAHEPTIRSTDGNSWSGEGDFLHTEGNMPQGPFRTDNMKVARTQTHIPTTFAAIRLLPHTFFSRDVDRWINWATYYFVCNNPGPVIFENCEIIADDDYIYHVSDGWQYSGPAVDEPGIYCMRAPTPAPPDPFECTSQTVLTDFGEISHSRSWCFHGGQLVLAYFTADGEIKLAKQTDVDADTWDDSEVIFDGSGYTECRDPSIASDGSDRLFALWTGMENSSGDYRLLVSMKETPTDNWTEPIVAAISLYPNTFDDQHISCSTEKVLLPTGDSEYMVLIGYQANGITCSEISPKNLWAFLPAQQVSAENDVTRDPDTLCLESPYLYDAMFGWSYKVTADNGDIKFRNADFKTP